MSDYIKMRLISQGNLTIARNNKFTMSFIHLLNCIEVHRARQSWRFSLPDHLLSQPQTAWEAPMRRSCWRVSSPITRGALINHIIYTLWYHYWSISLTHCMISSHFLCCHCCFLQFCCWCLCYRCLSLLLLSLLLLLLLLYLLMLSLSLPLSSLLLSLLSLYVFFCFCCPCLRCHCLCCHCLRCHCYRCNCLNCHCPCRHCLHCQCLCCGCVVVGSRSTHVRVHQVVFPCDSRKPLQTLRYVIEFGSPF